MAWARSAASYGCWLLLFLLTPAGPDRLHCVCKQQPASQEVQVLCAPLVPLLQYGWPSEAQEDSATACACGSFWIPRHHDQTEVFELSLTRFGAPGFR